MVKDTTTLREEFLKGASDPKEAQAALEDFDRLTREMIAQENEAEKEERITNGHLSYLPSSSRLQLARAFSGAGQRLEDINPEKAEEIQNQARNKIFRP